MLYRVVWAVDLDTMSPRDAAKWAREIQLDLSSQALTFNVFTEEGDHTVISLHEDPEQDFTVQDFN